MKWAKNINGYGRLFCIVFLACTYKTLRFERKSKYLIAFTKEIYIEDTTVTKEGKCRKNPKIKI